MRIDLDQLSYKHPTLRTLGQWLESSTGLEFTVTSQRRIGDPGVHGTDPLRAIDLRCRVALIGLAIEQHINNTWEYDPERPDLQCALFHDAGSGAHLHIQVHDNTRLIR